MSSKKTLALVALAASAGLVLAGCSNSDPTADPDASSPAASGDSSAIIVGSAGFAESEIIGEIYAGALEANGITVERRFQIGARDIYLGALEDGSVDLLPDYSGNLLQFYDAETTAVTPEEIIEALPAALPEGFEVLDAAEAENKDSYNVTREFSEENGVTSLADLADLGIPLVVGGNPELAERPYGPQGLTEVYGVDASLVSFVPISDGGGAQTTSALLDGTVTLADIYSTTPSIAENDFVTLEDPENLILAQNVIPIINSDKATDEVVSILNEVSAALTTEDLIELNTLNQGADKVAPAKVAADWLAENGFTS
ncbi:ABC transporter substrate-binding protein [Humidisolicoccus flavus]|uniref:ABC transporter substrate-binding protein n=1 Tax=Humidisolicoccus flavus TaxID=3111414 RepID=UPI0032485D0B